MLPAKQNTASAEAASLSPGVKRDVESRAVVSVGNNQGLLNLRERTFRNMGLSVQTMTPLQASRLAHSSENRVWVFCNSMELGELISLASAVRKCSPDSRLLLLEGSRPVGDEANLFHNVFDCVRDTRELLATLKHLATDR
jgi:hypothetical protein